MMIIIGFIILGLVIISIGMGLLYADEYHASIELIHPSSGMYVFGISSRNYKWDNGDRENRIELGLYLIVISTSFFLHAENIPTDEESRGTILN